MCEATRSAGSGNVTAQVVSRTVSKVERDKLIQYYQRRNDALGFCAVTSHEAIEDEKQKILDLVNKGQRPPNAPEIQYALEKLTGPTASTSRNCMFIAVCCFLEDLLRRAGNLALDDYDSEFKRDKKENRENFLRTHVRVLQTKVGIDFNSVKKHVVLLDHAVLIRNSLVHAWGKVDTSTNSDKLREALDTVDWAVESADGYVALDDQAYLRVMIATVELVEHVFEQLPPSE
jgi:hypothetical protein